MDGVKSVNQKYLHTYIKTILNNWVFLIGALSTIISVLTFFIPNLADNIPISKELYITLAGMVLAVLFIWASYVAWKELIVKLGNEVDYKITAEFENLADLNFQEQDALDQINILSELIGRQSPIDRHLDTVRPFFNGYSNEAKKNMLEEYLQSVEEYREIAEGMYCIGFILKNVGIKSDEQIRCTLVNYNDPRIIKNESKLFTIDVKPEFPKFETVLTHADMLLPSSNEPPYREKIDEDCWKITYLHVGDNTSIMYPDEGIYVKGSGDYTFEFEITSKYSKEVIYKKVNVVLG